MAPQLSYVIAVDFEATCWENQPLPQFRRSEIIEFPAVLVNLVTGVTEAEFHEFVKPVEKPELSQFCIQLTGISQEQVNLGISLKEALVKFHDWLNFNLYSRNLLLPKVSMNNTKGNCAFVTWTDWDFNICLQQECARKCIPKPSYFNQWMDARAIYRMIYKYNPSSFLDALQRVGLQFDGRPHSGIADAKNVGALLCKMSRDGHSNYINITRDLSPHQQLNASCGFLKCD